MKMKSIVRVETRIHRCRVLVDVGADRLRRQLLVVLEEVFHIASNYARGSVDRVSDQNEKKRPLTLGQRHLWVQVATLTAEIIASVNKGIDECQINRDLCGLEALLNKIAEAKPAQRDE